jgi:hypothetical protein
MPRAWRPLQASAQQTYYVSLCCSDDSASVRVTDLCDWWTCELDAEAIEEQKREYSITEALNKLLQHFMEAFEETLPSKDYHFEVERPDGADSPLLLRLVFINMRMEFACVKAPEAERAARVRDEFTLPALLTLEQLDRLVPETTAWEAPADGAAAPSFQRPRCQQIYRWALAQGDSAGSAPDGPSLGAADVAPAADVPEAGAAASAGAANASVDPNEEARRLRIQQAREKRQKAAAKVAATESAKRAKTG